MKKYESNIGYSIFDEDYYKGMCQELGLIFEDYNLQQLEQISYGWINHIPIDEYSDPTLTSEQMFIIRQDVEKRYREYER